VNHSEIVSWLWGVADLIRDTFKRGKYQDVILPLTVLRRLDCVLAPTKPKVLARRAELRKKGLQDLDGQLRKTAGFAFYNTSKYDFEKLLADAPQLAANLRNYIAGLSPNMREVIEKFDFDNTVSKLDEAGLFKVVERFKNVDLHPDKVDNPTMGTIFEELIRKFNEALDENPGEHFTPRDVVHLMVDLMLAGDSDRIRKKGIVQTVYDPCCGSGGMLTIAKEHVLDGVRRNGDILRPPINRDADIHLFGQEVNPETWAVSKSDLFIKEPRGRDADNIEFGSTLSNDKHEGKSFDYLIANPPYGKDWKRDEEKVRTEHERGPAGRSLPVSPGSATDSCTRVRRVHSCGRLSAGPYLRSLQIEAGVARALGHRLAAILHDLRVACFSACAAQLVANRRFLRRYDRRLLIGHESILDCGHMGTIFIGAQSQLVFPVRQPQGRSPFRRRHEQRRLPVGVVERERDLIAALECEVAAPLLTGAIVEHHAGRRIAA
jgi:hypothetical protein